jgi:hypothetical protein
MRLLCVDWFELYEYLLGAVCRRMFYRLHAQHFAVQINTTILFCSINLSFGQSWYIKTLESNCNLKNYLADSRFVSPVDLLTFPPIGGTFFRIQDGSKSMSLEIVSYLVPRSRKKTSLGTRMARPCLESTNVYAELATAPRDSALVKPRLPEELCDAPVCI